MCARARARACVCVCVCVCVCFTLSLSLKKSVYSITSFNSVQTKPLFLLVCSSCLFKTLWEKAKFLVTSSFSFSHTVFYPFGELSAKFIKFEFPNSISLEVSFVENLLFGKGFKRRLAICICFLFFVHIYVGKILSCF